VALAPGAPADIRAKRAQIAAIESQLGVLDAKVERAAEAYNGARYKLGLVQKRIVENRRVLAVSRRDLTRARDTLARRLRDIYRQDVPSFAEVLLTSGSVVAAVDKLDLLDRLGRQDESVVGNIRTFRVRLRIARAQLIVDRGEARRQVDAAHRERARVEGLLAQRREVLQGAKGDLRRLIAQERERRRREAELLRQRAAAAQRAYSVSPAVKIAGPLPSGAGNAEAARLALGYQGVPYVWGGASPSGFDCSGLASYVYAQIGKSVPHYTGAIWASFPQVPSDQLQAGDLVFFNGLEHVGIYIGNGQFVHAPHTGDVVRVANLADRGDYVGAVRP
jgi:peptidoglycan DL-endopeptidase CwlO